MVEPDLLGHDLGVRQREVLVRVDVKALDVLGVLPRDFLDLGAACCGGKHIVVARRAVHRDRHVVFMQDVGRFADKHTVHLVPAHLHGQDSLRQCDRFIVVVGDFDCAGLATVADFGLALDDAGIPDLVGSLPGFLRRQCVDSLRDGNALFHKELSALIFIEIHVSTPFLPCVPLTHLYKTNSISSVLFPPEWFSHKIAKVLRGGAAAQVRPAWRRGWKSARPSADRSR